MSFSVKPMITDCPDLTTFLADRQIGEHDLIITNEYLLMPQLGGAEPPCDVLFQERYGRGEPSDEMVDAMLAAADTLRRTSYGAAANTSTDTSFEAASDTLQQTREYRRIIAIGGGTVIDIAKLFVFGGGLSCAEIYAGGASLPRKRDLIIVPTTCGTGSEVTGISIIEFIEKHTKLGLAVPALFADEAVLIPSLLETLPYEVFATSSIDALIHAVESYVSPKANGFTKALGSCAIKQIIAGYRELTARQSSAAQADGAHAAAAAHPQETQADGAHAAAAQPQETQVQRVLPADMGRYLTASTMAGIAFGIAGVGAVHAMAYPIGGVFHVPHGKANYLVFTAVFAAYKRLGADLAELEDVLAGALQCGVGEVWEELPALLERILNKQPLTEFGADAAICAEMAESVIKNQQRLLVNNPVPLTQEHVKDIYIGCL